ncbi:MAG TPA: hypothetical protein VFP89_11670 [Propionibacteriaceae bacterium]|nr:hypothetical protein [Propionibacteriaceae bacterium]
MERALVRAFGLLLATLVSATTLLLWPSPPAAAAEPVPSVSITLTSIDPSLPRRDGTVTLTGRVTNVTDEPLFRLQAIFWRNRAPITSRTDLTQTLAAPSNEPSGARLTSSFQDLYSAASPYLNPGQSASFALRAKVTDLDLPSAGGVYLMGVHVLQNGDLTAVGRARVFVPVLDQLPRNVLQLTSVVMLSSRPSEVRRGVFADDHLAAEIAPGGRLFALLAAARRPDMSFAVDPSLIDELQVMEDGYQVVSANGSTEAGAGAADASRWLAAYAEVSRLQDGFRLPYGAPDLAALAHTDSVAVLNRGASAAEGVSETASLRLIAMPAVGAADAATLKAAQTLNPAAILLSDTSTGGAGPLLQGITGAPILTFTSTAFSGGPGPTPSNTPVHLQQRILADTWIEAATSPVGSTLGRVRVITNADQAQGDDESLRVPWMKRTTVSQLLASTPRSWSKQLSYPQAARTAELSRRQLRNTAELSGDYNTYAELLAEPAQARTAADQAVARSVSATWRGQSGDSTSFVGTQLADLDAVLRDGVRLSTTARVTTSGARGAFPITVLNRLTASDDPQVNAIRVRIVFTSDSTQRVTIDPLTTDLVPAQRNFTANAQVNASTNGTVRIRAQMTTLSGVPVGRSIGIDVKVTQAGTVGWFIAIGAGAVLIGATALRIRQVARERSESAPEASGNDHRDASGQRGGADTGGGPDGPPPVTPPAVRGADTGVAPIDLNPARRFDD